jgi:hypothetical protein
MAQCSQGSDEKQVLLKCWFGLLNDQAVGGLQHHLAGCVRGIVVGEGLTECVERFHLGDDVERVPDGKLQVDMGERFKSRAEL